MNSQFLNDNDIEIDQINNFDPVKLEKAFTNLSYPQFDTNQSYVN